MTTLALPPVEHGLAVEIAAAIIGRMENEADQKAEAQAQLDDICCNVLPQLSDDERVLMQIELHPLVTSLRARIAGAVDLAETYLTAATQFQRETGLSFGLLVLANKGDVQ